MNANKELMQEWFRKADNDLRNAEIVLTSGQEPIPLDTVCFHCQQAVEKYLKGFLVDHEVEFPRTHFLGTLLDLCREKDDTFETLEEVLELNAYAVAIRYPDETIEVTITEAQRAYQIASHVKSFVIELIEQQVQQDE